MATYTSQYPPAQSDVYIKATTKLGTSYWPYYATDPAKLVTGVGLGNSWGSASGTYTNQRFHIDLGSAKAIRRIYYENFHYSGGDITAGVKNFTFWGSNTASDFADLTYANDGNWVEIEDTELSQSYFDEHSGADEADPKFITVTNETEYRYYAFKFADNWGLASFMGVRRIELQTEDGWTLPSAVNSIFFGSNL
ncbi:hypothetical protein ES705_30080 [subsurface metagenome]